MFGSFFLLSLFVYVLHIVQAAVLYRTYTTALCLVVCGFGIVQEYDRCAQYLWSSACIWLVYSIIYFDIRTHVQSFYWLFVFGYVLFPFFSWRRLYEVKRFGVLYRIIYWLYVFFTPSLYGNIYGNALYSIVKLLFVVLLILTDLSGGGKLEYYSWPLFCHEIILLFVPFQIICNVLPLFQPKLSQSTTVQSTKKNDIIGHKDVPFLFNRKSSV